MTTLIITHTNGFTSCFTRNGDGLKQRALIDTGNDGLTPEQLAQFGEELASQYNWLNQNAPTLGILSAKPLALPKPRNPNNPAIGDLQPNEPSGNERKKAILEFLSDNPESTTRDIIVGMGFSYDVRISGRWNHYMNQMVTDRLLKRKRIGNTNTYSVR